MMLQIKASHFCFLSFSFDGWFPIVTSDVYLLITRDTLDMTGTCQLWCVSTVHFPWEEDIVVNENCIRRRYITEREFALCHLWSTLRLPSVITYLIWCVRAKDSQLAEFTPTTVAEGFKRLHSKYGKYITYRTCHTVTRDNENTVSLVKSRIFTVWHGRLIASYRSAFPEGVWQI